MSYRLTHCDQLAKPKKVHPQHVADRNSVYWKDEIVDERAACYRSLKRKKTSSSSRSSSKAPPAKRRRKNKKTGGRPKKKAAIGRPKKVVRGRPPKPRPVGRPPKSSPNGRPKKKNPNGRPPKSAPVGRPKNVGKSYGNLGVFTYNEAELDKRYMCLGMKCHKSFTSKTKYRGHAESSCPNRFDKNYIKREKVDDMISEVTKKKKFVCGRNDYEDGKRSNVVYHIKTDHFNATPKIN